MKIRYFIFGIILNILLIINVSAATISFEKNSFTINESETQKDVYINLKPAADEEIKRVEFSLSYDINLISVMSNGQSDFLQSAANNASTVLITSPSDDKLLTGQIFSFNIKNESSEEATTEIKIEKLKINGVEVSAEELSEIKPLNITLKKQVTTTTRALNTSAELKGIKLNNNATLKPAFSKDEKEYKIYISKDTIKQITITPQYEQSGVQMEVECTLGCTPVDNAMNKLNLVVGKNEATFTFTSEDGKDKKEYKFIIYRGPTTDGSNLLSGLSFEEDVKINEKFDKSNLDYTATVPYSIEKLSVVATPEDSNADVSIKGNDNLSVGENVITVTVTSTETMEKKIYNITVTREDFVPEEENNTVVTPTIEKTELPKKDNNIKLIIIIGLISTLIIGLAAYFIFFYKGKKKKNKAEKNTSEFEDTPKMQNVLIDEDREPTSVDDALKDLMKTKEMSEIDDRPTNLE